MPELTAPLVLKNDEKRIVYGPVLVPDEEDSDGDAVTAEKIEEVAHKFVEDYGNIDLQHSLNNVGKMIESYILPMDYEIDENLTVPKGSWMLGVRVTDDDSWQSVKDQKLGGFSIMAIEKAAMKSSAAEKDSAQKRTTLNDLEEGWIVNAVSLVDEPAVPKAKYIAVKSKTSEKENVQKEAVGEITDETVEKAVQGSLEDKERLVRRHVYATFDTDHTESYVHSTFDDSVIIRLEDYARNKNFLLQLSYEIDQQGNVTFTGEPQEVRIQESVVAIEPDDPLGVLLSKVSEDIYSSQKEQEDEAKQKESGLKGWLKKFFSPENEDEGKGDVSMKEEEVKEMIQKSVEPLQDQVKELVSTLKGSNEEDDQQESSQKSTESAENEDSESSEDQSTESSTKSSDNAENESDNEETVSKKEFDEVVKELEKAQEYQPFSKRLAGQDNLGAEKSKGEFEEDDRNAFGYKSK